ncbi:MAG: hypothetical protein ABJ251_10490 [Paracoccaceae bacterium]
MTEFSAQRFIGLEPPGENGIDCAILRLTHPAPPEVGFTLLSVIERRDMRKDDLSIYGSLEPHQPGTHVAASLSGNVAVGWTQINIEGQARDGLVRTDQIDRTQQPSAPQSTHWRHSPRHRYRY